MTKYNTAHYLPTQEEVKAAAMSLAAQAKAGTLKFPSPLNLDGFFTSNDVRAELSCLNKGKIISGAKVHVEMKVLFKEHSRPSLTGYFHIV